MFHSLNITSVFHSGTDKFNNHQLTQKNWLTHSQKQSTKVVELWEKHPLKSLSSRKQKRYRIIAKRKDFCFMSNFFVHLVGKNFISESFQNFYCTQPRLVEKNKHRKMQYWWKAFPIRTRFFWSVSTGLFSTNQQFFLKLSVCTRSVSYCVRDGRCTWNWSKLDFDIRICYVFGSFTSVMVMKIA